MLVVIHWKEQDLEQLNSIRIAEARRDFFLWELRNWEGEKNMPQQKLGTRCTGDLEWCCTNIFQNTRFTDLS